MGLIYQVDNNWKPAPATAVVVTGPHPNATAASDWEEFPEWAVATQDADGEDVGKVYRCGTYAGAVDLGQRMARDRHLEFVNEASPSF